ELGLTKGQLAAAKGLFVKAHGREIDAAAVKKALAKALKPAQLKRLKEISYQVRGGAALGDEEVAKELALTAGPQGDLLKIWKDAESKLRNALAVINWSSDRAKWKYVAKHRREAAGQMLRALPDEKRKQFSKLQGKAIDITGLDVE